MDLSQRGEYTLCRIEVRRDEILQTHFVWLPVGSFRVGKTVRLRCPEMLWFNGGIVRETYQTVNTGEPEPKRSKVRRSG